MQAPVKGFKPNSKKKKRGGKITGPGTGTSDDIQKSIPSGSYIMPADSTEAIGEENLQGMGQPVEAMVSNGEYELPPEQVHAIGAQALDQMRAQTHMPADTDPAMGGYGFHPDMNDPDRDMPELPKFASGGLVTEEDAARMRRMDGTRRPATAAAQPAQPAQPAAAQSAPASSARPAAGAAQPRANGIDPLAMEQVRKAREMDSHRYRAESMAQDARQAEAAANFKKPQQPAAGSRGLGSRALSGGRDLVNKAGRGGAVLAAVPGLINATGGEDIERQYAKRFGWEDTYDSGNMGFGQFMAMRGLGFASDVGSAMTLGLADKLYRDKQEINREALGTVGGGIAGGVAGNKAMGIVGKAIDGGLGILSRGKYKGNAAEKLLNSRVGRATGTLAGGVMGANAGQALVGGDDEVQAAPAPAQDPAAVAPADASQEQVLDQPVGAAAAQQPEFYASGIQKPDMVDGVPTFTNEHVKGFDPNSINTISSEAMSSADPSTMAKLAEARAAAVARGEPVPGVGGFQGGTRFNVIPDSGRMDDMKRKAFAAASMPHAGAQNGQLTASQLNAMRGLINDEQEGGRADQRLDLDRQTGARDEQRLGNEGQRLQMDNRKQMFDEFTKMPEMQQAQIKSNLLQRYQQASEANDTESAKALASMLQELNTAAGGSENLRNNFMTVGGGQEWDNQAGVMRNVPQSLVDLRTGQPVGGFQPQQQFPQPSDNHIRALRRNGKSKQEIANFESIYGPGSASRYLD